MERVESTFTQAAAQRVQPVSPAAVRQMAIDNGELSRLVKSIEEMARRLRLSQAAEYPREMRHRR